MLQSIIQRQILARLGADEEILFDVEDTVSPVVVAHPRLGISRTPTARRETAVCRRYSSNCVVRKMAEYRAAMTVDAPSMIPEMVDEAFQRGEFLFPGNNQGDLLTGASFRRPRHHS